MVEGGNAPVLTPESHAGVYNQRTRVLVVDDDPVVRRVARRGLQLAGLEVHEAADGHAAVEQFASDPDGFDVVIVDHQMPGLSGTETVLRVRSIRPAVRVVLVSGYDRLDLMSAFHPRDTPEFLQKPYKLSRLVDVVCGRSHG